MTYGIPVRCIIFGYCFIFIIASLQGKITRNLYMIYFPMNNRLFIKPWFNLSIQRFVDVQRIVPGNLISILNELNGYLIFNCMLYHVHI